MLQMLSQSDLYDAIILAQVITLNLSPNWYSVTALALVVCAKALKVIYYRPKLKIADETKEKLDSVSQEVNKLKLKLGFR